MLGRVLGVALVGCVMAAACGGEGFKTHGDQSPGGDAGAPPVASSGAGSGATSPGGSGAEAGAPAQAGAGDEGGAGGAPVATPIVVVRASRTSIVGNSDPSLTLNPTPSAGNALIVGITCFTEVENCVIEEGTGVTDNQGNFYRLVVEGSSIVSSDTHGSRPYLFIAENIPAPTGSVTITVNPLGEPDMSFQNFAWGVLEVSGLAVQDSVDQTGIFPNSCCPTATTVTTAGPTAQANELAVAVHAARHNGNVFGYEPQEGWAQHHVNEDGVSLASQHSLVSLILEETGEVSHTWTHVEPSRGVSAIIATFRGVSP